LHVLRVRQRRAPAGATCINYAVMPSLCSSSAWRLCINCCINDVAVQLNSELLTERSSTVFVFRHRVICPCTILLAERARTAYRASAQLTAESTALREEWSSSGVLLEDSSSSLSFRSFVCTVLLLRAQRRLPSGQSGSHKWCEATPTVTPQIRLHRCVCTACSGRSHAARR
jgi:hypothetical protein